VTQIDVVENCGASALGIYTESWLLAKLSGQQSLNVNIDISNGLRTAGDRLNGAHVTGFFTTLRKLAMPLPCLHGNQVGENNAQ